MMIDSFTSEYVVVPKGVAGEDASGGAVPRRAKVTSLLTRTDRSMIHFPEVITKTSHKTRPKTMPRTRALQT